MPTSALADTWAVLQNNDVTNASATMRGVFQHDYWGNAIASPSSHKSYRPLTTLTFKIQASGGLNAREFHAGNVLAHAVASGLATEVARRVVFARAGASSARHLSAAAGLLFAVHPVNVESVASVVGRAEVLASIFFSTAVLTHDGAMKSWPQRPVVSCALLGAAIMASIAAMLCKESGITALCVCMVAELVPIRSKRRHRSWAPLSRAATLGACAAAVLTWRLRLNDGPPPRFEAVDNPIAYCDSALTRVLTVPHRAARHLWLLLYPVHLCCDWAPGGPDPLVQGVWDRRNVDTVAALAMLMALCIGASRGSSAKGPPTGGALSMGLALLVIPFVPAANVFFDVGFVVAERVLYQPSLGFCCLLAAAVVGTQRGEESWWRSPRGRARGVSLVALFALLACRTWDRIGDWATSESLYESGIRENPYSARMHANLAAVLQQRAQAAVGAPAMFDAAVTHYQLALELRPDYPVALLHYGTLLSQMGAKDQARDVLERAMLLDASNAQVMIQLGLVHMDAGDTESAERMLRAALDVDPEYENAHNNLAMLLHTQGRVDAAAAHYRRALSHGSPVESEVASNLGILAHESGRLAEAEVLYRRALRASPTSAPVHNNLALLLEQTGRWDTAEALYERAVELAPAYADAVSNLHSLRSRRLDNVGGAGLRSDH